MVAMSLPSPGKVSDPIFPDDASTPLCSSACFVAIVRHQVDLVVASERRAHHEERVVAPAHGGDTPGNLRPIYRCRQICGSDVKTRLVKNIFCGRVCCLPGVPFGAAGYR